MSKADRIPEAWPAQMSDMTAARYLDISPSQFLAMVRSGKLPPGRKFGGTTLVRWHRRRLDEALSAMHGLDDPEDDDNQVNEWLVRVREGRLKSKDPLVDLADRGALSKKRR